MDAENIGPANAQPTVVLLHSLGGSPDQWSAQIKFLDGKARIFAPFLPGHGLPGHGLPGHGLPGHGLPGHGLPGHGLPGHSENTLPSGAPSIENLADNIIELINEQGIDSFILAGHSAGGSIAIAIAEKLPERVTGLFLVDPAGDLRMNPADDSAAFLRQLRSNAYQTVINSYWDSILDEATQNTRIVTKRDLNNTPKETIIYTLDALTRFNPVTTLKTFPAPSINIISPINQAPYSLHVIIPELNTLDVPNVSHWLHMDDPATINRQFGMFIEDITRRNKKT